MMWKVTAISAASAVLGYAAVHFAFFAEPKPAPAPEAAAVVHAAPGPFVLDTVIEVTDTDALLDVRPQEPERALFDTHVVTAGLTEPASVPPIPLAAEMDE